MNYQRIIGLILAVGILNGCASGTTEQKLDEKMNQEPATLTRSELHRDAGQWIQDSKSLSIDQRGRLMSLRESISSQDDALRKKSLKLRALLITEIFSADFNPDEIQAIQDDIKSTEKERLSLLFKAVRETNVILGRFASQNARQSEEFYNEMMLEIGPPGYY